MVVPPYLPAVLPRPKIRKVLLDADTQSQHAPLNRWAEAVAAQSNIGLISARVNNHNPIYENTLLYRMKAAVESVPSCDTLLIPAKDTVGAKPTSESAVHEHRQDPCGIPSAWLPANKHHNELPVIRET